MTADRAVEEAQPQGLGRQLGVHPFFANPDYAQPRKGLGQKPRSPLANGSGSRTNRVFALAKRLSFIAMDNTHQPPIKNVSTVNI